MRILVISEARTGGTTLMDYLEIVFLGYKIVTEPYTNLKDWIETNDITNVDWYKKRDNVIVKEIYKEEYDFKNFIDSSDKIICVYRNNWYEQVKSVLYAEVGDKFLHNYNIKDVNKHITDRMIYDRYIKTNRKLKKSFINFIESNNFLSVSYEDLYYEDGIDIIKKYLNIESETTFPPIKKYLKNIDGIEYKPNNIKNYDEDYLNFLEIEYMTGYDYKEPKIIKGKPNKLI